MLLFLFLRNLQSVMHGFPFGEQMAFLGQRLQQDLPGIHAHLDMAPASRVVPGALSIEGKPCRRAAVLAVLFPLEEASGISTGVLLTKRKQNLSKHAGQISFPGGKQEQDETLTQTALRETHEEIGLYSKDIELLGSLSPLYINVSNFCVHPFVGALQQPPESLTPQDDEVEKILKVPLKKLADPSIEHREKWVINGAEISVPFYAYEGETIWGATAMMLAELLRLFRRDD